MLWLWERDVAAGYGEVERWRERVRRGGGWGKIVVSGEGVGGVCKEPAVEK